MLEALEVQRGAAMRRKLDLPRCPVQMGMIMVGMLRCLQILTAVTTQMANGSECDTCMVLWLRIFVALAQSIQAHVFRCRLFFTCTVSPKGPGCCISLSAMT